MKNIIWENLQNQYIVTQFISDDVDSIAEKDKMIADGDAEGLTFIGVDYSQDQINELCKYQNLEQAKLDKIAQVLINRNDWMYQPVTYANRPYTATLIAGNNLIAAARSPRNIAIGSVNWMTDNGMAIELLIAEMEDIINLIENQRSYSYFHEATLYQQINAIEITPKVTYDQAMEALNNIDITF